jgi:hypothetical protein
MESSAKRQDSARTGIVIWLAIFAVLVIVGVFVGFFRWRDREGGKAATRRAENEQLKHAAMLREEERQSAYAGRVVKPGIGFLSKE